MRLLETRIENSESPNRLRLVGEVEYADGVRERIWYDVDRSLEESLDRSGSPWLAALLPVAVTLGEPLILSLPVDRTLLANCEQLMDIWSSWYPHLRPVAIEAEPADAPSDKSAGRWAAFFSGGVDSFLTVLRRLPPQCKLPLIDDLLCVWGFDIPIGKPADFARMQRSLSAAARETGQTLIDVATNLRETRFAAADWCKLSHGCALASVALLLSPRLAAAVIASSYGYRDMRPWGSHVLTDPLLSTSTMGIVHDGAELSRIEKTRIIAASDIARRHLRVCSIRESDGNCSDCNKCLRTMATLYLLGVLDDFETFDSSTFRIEKLERTYHATPAARAFYEDIMELARCCGREDVAAAIRKSLLFSARCDRALAFNGRLSRTMYRVPLLWRYSEPLCRWANRRALSGAIR